VNPLSPGVQNHKNRKPEPLWKIEIFECRQIPVFLAVIYLYDNKVFAHHRIDLLIRGAEPVKLYTPGAPIPTDLQKEVFIFCSRTYQSLADGCLGISQRII
jgi:hypothetical protein